MENTDKIRNAVGAYSVYLAALSDKKLTGRFTQVNGSGLLDHGNKATKRSIADVLVYMAAAYDKTLTTEEVEMGLLVAAGHATNTDAYESAKRKTGPDLDSLGDHYAERLRDLLDKGAIGLEISNLIDRFELHKNATCGYRTVEQAVGVALRSVGWDRRRQMTDGVRAYRWYPPTGYFDDAEDEPIEGDQSAVDEFDDVFDNVVEIVIEEPEVEKKPSKKGSGVKPDDALAERIRSSDLADGITSFALALACYDFDGNDIAVPNSEDEMVHKVKLSIGATMKGLGWTKRTRRIGGVPNVGWYSPDDWEFPESSSPEENVVLRKPEPVDVEPVANVADRLPRLTDAKKEEPPAEDDDLPWPDESEFIGDDGDDGDEGATESEPVAAWIKFVSADGKEDVLRMRIVSKNTGTFLSPTEDYPHGRMLEWDAEEDIWTCRDIHIEE